MKNYCPLNLQKKIINFELHSEFVSTMSKLSGIKIVFISVLLFFFSNGCKEDNFKFPYITINANIGIISDLGDLAAGGVKFFKKDRFGGVGGLLVYRDYEDEYFVFDAACTYDYFDDCTVRISESFQEKMECPCCSSEFLLSSDGNVFKGPARFPLVQYQAFTEGSVLRVVN